MSTWHGLTDEQVRELWAERPWQAVVASVLVQVAACSWMPADERVSALALLNESVIRGLLDLTPVDFPRFARDVTISMTVMGSRTPWWRRRTARRLRERVVAARCALGTMANFVPQASLAEMFGLAAPEPDKDPGRLLS